ncbi:hypothetical protein DICPUDRAFT_146553 [Dictyostelium purpureum]|uniref:Uncharacterized protein n=1 Tax=Dictyostelium purpureum TaxID=5786 RepID=F0Z695_DICPU|nr:uncharacterized protein DICPUDRAFT_146553 [Dictyostelium purpureum]EGC40615.1 hypothetical protein DICPUDRAFT_146553 [Dictyostelium purpureum]|eukprot:XP_003282951.1 hypothetical protein DICPUDRAFT_146553 [Dictyostelium purpureum]
MSLNGSNSQFDDIDIESFSSHVIASLLVLPTDYKPDNLILEEDSNYIVGIDNDQSLEANEFDLTSEGTDAFPRLRNVLYTLKPLMVQPVNESVKNTILKTNSPLFIIKWLEALYRKQNNYDSIISMQIESKGLEVSNEYLKIKKEEINLPLEFNKGWVNLMDTRFKKIQQILQSNQSATHQDLFNHIHPLTSIYYEYLSKMYKHQPLDIISTFYQSQDKLSFQDILNIENPQFNQEHFKELLKKSLILEKPISIYDTIKEYITTIEFSSLLQCKKTNDDLNECGENCNISCKTRIIVLDFLSTICSLFDYTFFHPSWYIEKFNIFSKLLRYGASVDIIKLIVTSLNILIKNEEYNTIIREKEVLTNPNICNQIEFLIEYFELDIERVENKSNLLDLVSTHNLTNLFIKLLELGAGKNSNPCVINRYYQNLSNDQKLKLKPFLINLFTINPKINWRIAINQLFPLQNEQTRNSTKILSEISNSTKRFISDKYWDQLFDSNGQPKRSNEYGSRTVTLIQDNFGNGIYLKFKPQFPGTEIAVNKLSNIIFGNGLTPHCELASINGLPVLLIQQVYGEPLVDIFNDSPNIINQIEPFNISKQLILSMLINNADGNLGNFIVSKTCSFKDQRYDYKLVSIDNDQCFMPSISKSLGMFEKSLQVDTVLFLFNQMNDKVHKDVIDRICNIDVYTQLFKWLEYLKYKHQSSLDHFSSNRERLKKEKETVIGVSFNRGMISHIFSKLNRLQKLLKENGSVTHLEVLEYIEPLVSNRYKPFLNQYVSPNDRYLKLKNFNTYSKTLVSCSKHSSNKILLSRDIPNVKDIMDQLWSGKYGPSQSLEELKSLDNDVKTLNDLINLLDNKTVNLKRSIKSVNINIHEITQSYKNLEYLNISESIYVTLHIRSNLKTLDISSMIFLLQITLEVNYIESINFEGCCLLNEIKGSGNYYQNLNLWKSLNNPYNKQIIEEKNMIINLRNDNIILSWNEEYIRGVSFIFENRIVPLTTLIQHHVIIGGSIHNIIVPKETEFISLCDNFNESLHADFFPKYLSCLYLGNIKKEIKKEILPPFLKILYLGSGYQYKLSNIINCTIETLYLEDIKEALQENTLRPSIENLILCPGFNHPITPSVIPNTVKRLSIISKKKDIEVPTSIKFLEFNDDSYSPEIIKPFKVKDLLISTVYYSGGIKFYKGQITLIRRRYKEIPYFTKETNINRTLDIFTIENFKNFFGINSLKKSAKVLEYWDPPNSRNIITEINSKIKNLYIGYLNYIIPLELLPPNIKRLELLDGFDQTLLPHQLPNTIKHLVIGGIKKPLNINSISKATTLTLLRGFDNQLIPGVIGESVTNLYIDELKYQLKPNVIPSSVVKLRISDHQIETNTIPLSVSDAHITFNNIVLQPNSIPSSITTLTILINNFNDLNHSLIPNSVKNLYIINNSSNSIPINFVIPNSVILLQLRGNFDYIKPGIIPDSVRELYIDQINIPFKIKSIPYSVTSLEVGGSFNKSLPFIIPDSVAESGIIKDSVTEFWF